MNPFVAKYFAAGPPFSQIPWLSKTLLFSPTSNVHPLAVGLGSAGESDSFTNNSNYTQAKHTQRRRIPIESTRKKRDWYTGGCLKVTDTYFCFLQIVKTRTLRSNIAVEPEQPTVSA